MELGISVFAGNEDIGPGRRRVWTHVEDPRYPGLQGVFSYTVLYVCPHATEDPNGPIDTEMLLGAHMHGVGIQRSDSAPPKKGHPHLSVSYMRDLPMSTWEVASRERLGAALLSDEGKSVLRTVPGEVTEILVDRPHLDLDSVDEIAAALIQGMYGDIDRSTPAGRRRYFSLLKQARAAALYQQLVASGRTDPAAEIAKAYNVSSGAARTWIHRARQSGFLGKALGTVAGQESTLSPAENDASEPN